MRWRYEDDTLYVKKKVHEILIQLLIKQEKMPLTLFALKGGNLMMYIIQKKILKITILIEVFYKKYQVVKFPLDFFLCFIILVVLRQMDCKIWLALSEVLYMM